MPISDHQAVPAFHNGKRIRGIYRQADGSFKVRKGAVEITVPEYIYSFDFTVSGQRFRSVFGRESEHGTIGANGKWESSAIAMAVEALLRFKKNAKNGKGATSIKEEIELSREVAEEEKRLKKQEKTIAELIDLFLDDIARTAPNIKTLEPSTINEYRLNLKRDVEPAIGKLKAKSIEREDIAEIIENIAKRGAFVQANRTLATCSRLFNWALKKGRVRYNPCALMEKYPEKPRTRVLTEPEKKEPCKNLPTHAEIKILWENLSEDFFCTEACILLLCIMLGARPGEICAMKWEDIDEDNWWSLDKTKGHVILDCYLTKTARGIIRRKQNSVYVFPKKTDNTAPFSVNSLSKYVVRKKYFGLPPWQPRDLRRTFTTLSTGFGFDDKIINKAQARKDSSILRKHYDKRKYYPEIKSLFEIVEKEIIRIVESK